MTLSVCPIGVTFDGDDVQWADLGVVLEITHGIGETPNVRGDDPVVPGDPGRGEGNRVNDMLVIQLYGFVQASLEPSSGATPAESYAANRAWVRSLFATNRDRAALVATLEDGTTATIQARPLPGTAWTTVVPGAFAYVDIQLEGVGDWEYT